MSRSYPFAAELALSFRPSLLDTCENCGKSKDQHAQEHCLFEPTSFAFNPLHRFFGELMRTGGVLVLKSEHFTFEQLVTARDFEKWGHGAHGEMRTVGDATLLESDHAP